MNLGELLLSEASPNELALKDFSDSSASCTYGDLINKVRLYKGCFATQVRAQEAVILYFDNEVEFFPVFFALSALGVCSIPVSPNSGWARLRSVVDSSGASTVISLSGPPGEGATDFVSRWMNVSAIDFRNSLKDEENIEIDLDCNALGLFTSGSTGIPKGIVYTQRELIYAARNIIQSCALPKKNQELLLVPLSHSDGWQRAYATLLLGGCLCLSKQFKVSDLSVLLSELPITGLFLPTPLIPVFTRVSPAVTSRLNQTLKTVELGSTPLSSSTLEVLLKFFKNANVYYHYGLTECSRASTLNCRENPQKLHTVGKPNPGFMFRVSDGILEIKAEVRPRARLVDKNFTRDQTEWLITKDRVELDGDGFLIFLARSDDLISIGGYHIFPREIVETLKSVHSIQDLEVVINPDPAGFTGDRVSILIQMDKNSKPEELEKIRLLLPTYLRSYVMAVPHIPRSASGKFIRNS